MPDKSEYIKAFIALMLFRNYTDMPRPLEIAFSITAWGNLIIIILSLYVLIF